MGVGRGYLRRGIPQGDKDYRDKSVYLYTRIYAPLIMDITPLPRKPLSFGKTVLAAFLGFLGAHIIACGLAIVFFFVLIAMMIPSPSSRVPELASNSVLRIDLADLREIVTTDDWMQYLPGKKGSQPVSLTQAIEGIRRAKASDKIKGIYLNVESLNAGLASIDELRTALQDF